MFDVKDDFNFDAIVVGAGHAGIEAGLALSRLGCKTLLLSISLDNVGYLACNPSIGGTGKGHLVREIDALGGQMGISADAVLSQLRMLNYSKGPAVWSLRAQVDKYKYHFYMKRVLEDQPNLYLRQGEVKDILIDNNKKAAGVKTLYTTYFAKTVVLACGVYLKSNIIVGDTLLECGPAGFSSSNYLSDSLSRLGFKLRRFKTGTPARVYKDSINLNKFEIQNGEKTDYSFSDMTSNVENFKEVCYLGYTNADTHRIIMDNLDKSPRFLGLIRGTGARYCPSIEDKIVRFADKERHQFFLEPEGEGTKEMYVQGLSTSLPLEVQLDIYRSIEGLENVRIMRDAYAIEYDCIDSKVLYPTLMSKDIEGLFFAGQINGTSGYEEAAAQGIVAGINAAMLIKGKEQVVFTRDSSYIGVMIDDLVTKGTEEPYRIMTSKAEYRLILRQDNADLRLTPVGYKIGLVKQDRYLRYKQKEEDIKAIMSIENRILSPEKILNMFNEAEEPMPMRGLTIKEVVRRPKITPEIFNRYCDDLKSYCTAAVRHFFIETKYEGYLQRQNKSRQEAMRLENRLLPRDLDYSIINGLRIQAVEYLNKIKPLSIGQASRISGVSPSDINALIIGLKKLGIN